MSTSEVVEAQTRALSPFGVDIGLQQWYWLLLAPSFVIYVISMVGETNRAPFDLPECESELVSGHLTEYSGFRYAIYFLAEYINMATVSAVATTLFVGGYHAPWPINVLLPVLDQGWFGPLWFIIKVQLFISLFVWLRGTLPRFRYDQFMDLGWKWMIPISIVWIMAIATVRIVLTDEQVRTGPLPWVVAGIVVVALIALLIAGRQPLEPEAEESAVPEILDAFAGGFPVPPMAGQVLPEFAGVVRAQPAEEPSHPAADPSKEADS
jgi:NADH-quinone oxidoreductase subunit H